MNSVGKEFQRYESLAAAQLQCKTMGIN